MVFSVSGGFDEDEVVDLDDSDSTDEPIADTEDDDDFGGFGDEDDAS